MTHDEQTYQTGRQVRVRTVRGARSVISHAVPKGKNSEHVGRTGAVSEGRIRREGKVHHTMCAHTEQARR